LRKPPSSEEAVAVVCVGSLAAEELRERGPGAR
jgi:hypothetical protein